MVRFRHPNIVSVMGYSSEPLTAVVYEYIPGGSLYDRLHKVLCAMSIVAAQYFALLLSCTIREIQSPFSGRRDPSF